MWPLPSHQGGDVPADNDGDRVRSPRWGEAGLGDSIVTMAASSSGPLRGETPSVRLECRVLIQQLLWRVGCLRKRARCWVVGQWAQCSPHSGSSINPQHYIKPDVVVHIRNPSAWEVEAGELGVQSQPQ